LKGYNAIHRFELNEPVVVVAPIS